MTPEARTFILKCFCGQVSAVEVADVVNKTTLKSRDNVTAAQVREIWSEASETNPVFRELVDRFGERPVRGYARCEHVIVAEGLVA